MTLSEQIKEIEKMLNGKHIFTCPNYAIVWGTWNNAPIEFSMYGPGVKNWEKKNGQIIAAMKTGKLI